MLGLMMALENVTPTVLVSAAGAFKVLLCLFFHHSFRSGRLVFTCARTRTVADTVADEWATFQTQLVFDSVLAEGTGTQVQNGGKRHVPGGGTGWSPWGHRPRRGGAPAAGKRAGNGHQAR